jgi:VanZ family protein
MIHLVRSLGWLVVFAIVLVSLMPADIRAAMSTGMLGVIEHAVIYLLAAGLMALGYARNDGALLIVVIGLVCLAGLLETGQNLVPGRNVALSDFAAGAGGAVLGSVSGWIARALLISK